MLLTAFEKHKCIFCPGEFIRPNLKRHLTTAKKNGPRCPGLKKVISSDVWDNQILQYYKNDSPLPDLSCFKSTPLKRKRKENNNKKLYCTNINLLTEEKCLEIVFDIKNPRDSIVPRTPVL